MQLSLDAACAQNSEVPLDRRDKPYKYTQGLIDDAADEVLAHLRLQGGSFKMH